MCVRHRVTFQLRVQACILRTVQHPQSCAKVPSKLKREWIPNGESVVIPGICLRQEEEAKVEGEGAQEAEDRRNRPTCSDCDCYQGEKGENVFFHCPLQSPLSGTRTIIAQLIINRTTGSHVRGIAS